MLEPSQSADLKMRIWNSDGGEVESCGNATRCVVQLTGARRIDSDGGLLEGEDLGAEVEVALGEPRFGWDDIPLAYPLDTNPLPMAWGELIRPMALNVGNPHLVFFVDELDAVPTRQTSGRRSSMTRLSLIASTSMSPKSRTAEFGSRRGSAAPD